MSVKTLVTQGELGSLSNTLGALADNLNTHVNDSLSNAHGLTLEFSPYLDKGGNYHTDFGASTPQPIPGLFNTGVNNDGSLKTPGTSESHWVLTQVPYSPNGGAFIESPTGGYAFNPTKAQWLGPNINGHDTAPSGSYRYRLAFSLSGLNPSTAIIRGAWLSDDDTVAVYLNGVATGFHAPNNAFTFTSPIPFTLSTGFIAGTNTLEFLVSNSGGGPTAFICEFTSGTAYVGGPASIATLFNTGVNSDGTLASPGTVDAHWTLGTPSVDGTNPGPDLYVVNDAAGVYPFNGTWSNNGPRSKWLSTRPDFSVGHTTPAGQYIYRLTFDLSAYNVATVVIKGIWCSDDPTTAVVLNNVVIAGLTAPANTWKSQPSIPFVISTGFNAGINRLNFIVQGSGIRPSGVRVELSGTAQLAGTNQPGRVLRVTVGSTELFVPTQLSGGIDGTPDAIIPASSGSVLTQTADPASDLLVGSPTNCALVTTFASQVSAITDSTNAQLFDHAGDVPDNVHGGTSWQQDSIFSSAGYLVGRRSINIVYKGIAYKLVADTVMRGPGG